MKGTALKLFGMAFFVGLVMTSSLWARQIVTQEEREWARETVSREKELAAAISPNTIAVINFNNITDLDELKAVEKGMAIMLITDLAKLERYQIVERARMQALIDELQITAQGLTDPESNTRMGKLLGAEHVIGGDIIMQKLGEFKLESSLLDVPMESITGNPQAQGKLLAELFKMEKDLLFEIVKQLEIELTPEEEEELKKPITDDLQAFLQLIQGIDYSDQGDNQKALESFEFALIRDPDFKLAKILKDEIAENMEPGGTDPDVAVDSERSFLPYNMSIPDNQIPYDNDYPSYDRPVDVDEDGYENNLDCDDHNAGINPGADDSNCNGIDENCSGIPDDGYVPITTECGIGRCAAVGSTSCVNGAVVDSCVAGIPSADDNCNGIDDNCNGIPDDEYVSLATECGVGACAAEGSTTCVNATVVDSCVAGTPSPDNNCNGIDENCNGIPDDEYVSLATECGIGACFAEGTTSCSNGAVVDSCIAGTPAADDNCDGIDDNCNGEPDDDYLGYVVAICGYGPCVRSVESICVNGAVSEPICIPDWNKSSPEFCNDTVDNDCDGFVNENCDLVPPLVSVDSINMAHNNIFNEAGLNSSVNNGDFIPRTFYGFITESQPLSNAFGYAWEGNTGESIYGVNGADYNNLGLLSVGAISDQTLGLQTLGVDSDFIPVVMLPNAVLDQINSNPFLAYAVQVEEDRLNQKVMTLYQDAAQSKSNIELYIDIDIVMQDVMQQTQQAEFIRARDAFLLQKADAQSGRVLVDSSGNWVRTQQYILRPDDSSVQLLNVSLRGSGDNAGISTMDLRTNLTAPIAAGTDLRDLPWNNWLDTQGPNLPTPTFNERYIAVPDNVYELARMDVTFTNPEGGYLREIRTFNALENPEIWLQTVNQETLDLQLGTIFDNPVGQPRTYTTDWQTVALDQYWVADPEQPPFVWNFTGEIYTGPTLFAYMFRTEPGAGWEATPLLAVVATTVVGDADNAGNTGVSENDYSDQVIRDIWDALRTNEIDGPQIGFNNLEINIWGTDIWDVALPENNWQSFKPTSIVFTPMSRMLWKAP